MRLGHSRNVVMWNLVLMWVYGTSVLGYPCPQLKRRALGLCEKISVQS